MKIKSILMTCALGLALTGTKAFGVSGYVSLVPNGGTFSCSTCHTAVPTRNPFGLAFANAGHAWGAALASADSDGDGFSNGAELGDPTGTWRSGSPDPSGPVTNPGDPNSKPAVTAPSITTQPASQTVTAGANVSFTVVATGTAPLSYQWKKGGANITGANSATLTLNSVTTANAGSYTVDVSNSAGTVTSAAATLTVNVPPTITTQPASQTVTAGANVTFSVVATGTAPLSYQWMKNSANITGATGSSLVLNSVATTDAGSYSVRVSNVAGNITSSAATLTVNPAVVAPAITTQPASQTVTAGANVSFTVVATGTAPLSYQWKKGGANITGANSATLTLNSVTTANAGSYTVDVSNSAGTVTSAAATLTVNVPPTITTQPASQTVTAGANVTFNVVATGTAPLSYQWKKNGANITGANSASLTLNSVTTASAGSYTVDVSNVAGTVTSAAATLTVNPAVIAPTITTQPASQTVTAGANVSFTVVATGTAPLSYQWKKNGANITGANSATLALNGVTSSDAGSYTVDVSNSAGTVTSAAATLTVNPAVVAPTITTQPASQTVVAGANVSFTVVASGTAPLSYQWKKNGANITGANSATLALNSVTSADAGSYTVDVSNSAGTVTSAAATLTVNPAPVAPTITTQPASQTVTAGANVTFTVVATGTAPLSYQWKKNGANITGANSASLTLNSVTTTSAGSYTVDVSNSAGTVTSSPAVLTVNPAVVAPVITTQPVSRTVTVGANVSFTVVASGTAPLSYQWMKNNADIAGATSATLTLSSVTTADAGSYAVKVSNTAGSVTSAAATLTVNPAASLSVAITDPTNGESFVEGADVTITAAVTPATGIAGVEFFSGTTSLGTATAAPYTVTVNNLLAGDHVLTARVTDSTGATAVSQSVTITVTPPSSGNLPPVVQLLSPRPYATYSTRSSIVLAAQASDPDGQIAKVEFYSGSTLIGTGVRTQVGESDDDGYDSDSSRVVYVFVWSRVPAGQYTITARATDNLNASTDSAPVRITVRRGSYEYNRDSERSRYDD